MSPLPCRRVRLSKLSLISISIVFTAVALVWTTGQPAGAAAGNWRTSLSSAGVFVTDKGGTTPEATTITVNNTADVANGGDGLCTLREAITAANSNTASGATVGECAAGSSGSDVIDMTGLSGTINLAGALPSITSDMTLTGPGASQLTVRRNTGGDYRVFTISSGTVGISGIIITNGKTADGAAGTGGNNGSPGADGGGILNSGTLTLTSVTVTANTTGTGGIGDPPFATAGGDGGNGAGIANTGTLTVTNSTISGNTCGKGADNLTGVPGSKPGNGGAGGGIYSSKTLTITASTVDGNNAGLGGNGVAGGGQGGNGGGIYLQTPQTDSGAGVNSLTNVLVTNNGAGNLGTPANNDGGLGGGIFAAGVSWSLTNSTVSGNHTGNFGGGANSGNGGGIANGGSFLSDGSTISGNTSSNGAAGLLLAAPSKLSNTTVSGNTATGSDIPTAFGGGVRATATTLIVNSTITNNTVASGQGNGIAGNFATSTILRNTIVAGNGNGDTYGNFSSQGHNLIGNNSSCCFGGVGDQAGTSGSPINPQLRPLANNGGLTMTHALMSNSPALDAGDDCVFDVTHCSDTNMQILTDQRGSGFSRKVDGPDVDSTATVDIGSYEMQVPLANIPDQTINEDGQLVLLFDLGDPATVTSVTASSSNTVLVPNDAAHISVSSTGSTGTLTVNPATNQNGSTNITITVNRTVGGPDIKSFLLTVNPVNDVPLFTKGADQTVNEDAGGQTANNWATSISPGPSDESGQTVTFTVTNNNNALFSVQPAINSAGTLTYTPAANANGSATVTVTAKDDGGTANGGNDTSASQTFTITVNAVNDAPSFTKGANQTANEDAGAQSVVNWATSISRGAADESGQSVTFTATNDNNALFLTQPAISSTGTLSYTPAANGNGTATVTVTLKDNGGTANGGNDTSPPQTFTITVTAVNDAPSFTKGVNQTVNEDAGAQTVNNWATGISPGPADESGQTVAFQVTGNTNAALFSAGPAISSTGVLTYTPAADAFGSASVTINLKDNGGVANGGVDTSAQQSFTITVSAVNDAPSFTAGANQSVNEDAAPQSIANWATNISRGPANESAQALTFIVTNNNNALFSGQPGVSATGTLTYFTLADASGTATVTVTLQDSGGTANGGVATSPSQTFTITVAPVNDSPFFNKGADQTVNNNAGMQTVANWATSISPGPSDESAQTVAFQITGNSKPGLFSTAPAVSPTGTLTYQPAANQGGTAAITVQLKDNGGTANGGLDTSTAQTFNITVIPIGGSLAFTTPALNPTESSGSVTATVKRTGDISRPVTVDYATSGDNGLPCSTANGVATPKCDFTTATGTLSFAAGEDTKTFTILISQDSFVEGPETLSASLLNPTGGAALGSPATTSITIADDASEPPTNVIDDAGTFVRMHYHDFLNREADQSGLNFWTGQMTNCGSSDLLVCRVNVSGAFFLSIEFQQTGYLVERMYKTGYGDATATSQLGGSHQILVPVVRANEFLTDTQRIGRGVVVLQPGWETVLENNKQAYALEFVQTSRFISGFPTSMTPAQFVDKLNTNAGNVLSASERTAAINLFGNAADTTNINARAQALRQVVEDTDLYNAEFNRAFVLSEYIGYLRRNPNDAPEPTLDYTGYDFWLAKLNESNGDYIKAEMVKAFISSSEYRQRFGP